MSELGRVSFDRRLDRWLTTIGQPREGTKVSDLYQGEHWSVARSLPSEAVSVWTASAGFGLIAIDDEIPSYDATFATGQPNSVSRATSVSVRCTELRTWWTGIQSRLDRPRSETVATLNTTGPVIVAASQPYLEAMRTEIAAADDDPTHPLVIATVGSVPSGIAHLRMPCDGRLRNVLGGSMGAVSVRLAEQLAAIPEEDFSTASAIERTAKLMSDAEPLPEFKRRNVTDSEVIEFIEMRRARVANDSASKLLRELRNGGMACEQSRFHRLFKQTGGRN